MFVWKIHLNKSIFKNVIEQIPESGGWLSDFQAKFLQDKILRSYDGLKMGILHIVLMLESKTNTTEVTILIWYNLVTFENTLMDKVKIY